MRISLNTNVLGYLLDANRDGYDPADDPDQALAEQRVAAFRLYVYGPTPVTTPTARAEAIEHPDTNHKRERFVWLAFHLDELEDRWIDPQQLATRVAAFEGYHSGDGNRKDRCIVAESEQASVDSVASFDRGIRRLSAPVSTLFVGSPVECFARLGVPRGQTPLHPPDERHPLARASWWRW